MRKDFGNGDRHLAGVRALPRFAVHAQFHRQVVRIGDLVGRDDVRPQRAERIDPLAEAEDTRLHLLALNIARRDVVEDHVAADVLLGFLGREMLARFLQHDREFQFVIEFLGEVRRENHRLIGPDDGIHVLEEDNPRQHGMRETRPAGLRDGVRESCRRYGRTSWE